MANEASRTTAYLNWPRLLPAGVGVSDTTTPVLPSAVNVLLTPDYSLGELPPARRLLVLVPGPATPPELANRIWSLAAATELDVLFIGTAGRGNDEYAMRRLLATLAAATRDSRLRVDTKLVEGQNWLRAIRGLWQEGDLIICHQEQNITGWGFKRLPLAEALVVNLSAPVYVLTGFCPELPEDEPGPAGRLLDWLRPFLIIAVFCLLQIQIEQSLTNWLYYVLMILSILVELALLAIWH